ncbi:MULTISPECIES: DNA topoisomerase IV subunit B [Leeuwenhoekiella]|jgi:topoisomerase-4 subunit B|uniref:DNA topoisomerase (ATP-hydrolyzing) n=1 Tax=Leeuwenhoekiella blandensis (strain CECT 7118 / CCUG 51940 / KCTC 22103 / MED217) TaxID=398720 RepID=A3XNY0_LEEBM|nr:MULTISPECIES: DNA topoisomerase IV subunit B [Leeuwenhoekiella]EAQ48747.1 DNA topoisomerase IV subunit B [Leeuwenhoekiella blandensis MED217]MAO45053.1 type IIA DNA topoisomerase subunit B [Leeuwenhoekiella sp.]MBQ50993.1 type IIA DNA topoisomerase subunit B [Leeuwenhoekiella sp.]HCW63422.1 type IIA DNA topoisomerase subunit B [Leeuwenhoekiella sp.]|tara:strand:+ start:517 stop:2373 length:1857 start_codon:yes stop_codon:yes gene_type:complete
MAEQTKYTEDNIRSLDWKEHIRMRPGMYIGKLGDGSSADDGIYILLKEVLDNSIDEFVMGAGKTIEVSIQGTRVIVRDYGRGIPLGKVVDVVSKMNTGGKYDSRAFKKSVGLNGVGTKAVNALSEYFRVESTRDNKSASAEFERGTLKDEEFLDETSRRKGTKITFVPDDTIFKNYKFRNEYVSRMLKNYVYLNPGLTIVFNGEKFYSENGLKDLLGDRIAENDILYPIIHLRGDDIEVALTHSRTQYSEEYHSFVNGQNTTQGGTHQAAFREAVVRTIREFYNKNYDASDIRKSIVSAISIKVMEPVFESQTKTKLGSTDMGGELPTVRTYVNDFLKTKLDNYLHKNPETAEKLQRKILQAERERTELSGIRKLAKERAKKASLHNKKLRDCRVHLTDSKKERNLESTLFITEGDSASGSITKSRDVNTQAVFSLRGKPLNSYNMSKKIVYENEEFNLLQSALNIEESMEDLRYNNIVIATDADVDGMHIRLLLITFFLQFFPELIKEGHLFILETPLFRVRNKKKTIYCYSEQERRDAIEELSGKPEITRFKGLGEISPDEFKHFIGENIRLAPIMLDEAMSIEEILQFYMGKNTPDRQKFIINNLKVELDPVLEN